MKHFALAFLVGLTAVACTTVESEKTASNEECQTMEVQTGSRIARKRCVTKEQKEQEQKAAQDYLHRAQTLSGPKVKGQ